MLGKYASNKTQTNIETINGKTAKLMRPSVVSAIPIATKRLVPRGGVKKPISQLTTKTIPKWIGSILACVITGRKRGVKIMICAIVFSHIPTNVKNTLIRTSIKKGFSVIPVINLVTIRGISWMFISSPKARDAPQNQNFADFLNTSEVGGLESCPGCFARCILASLHMYVTGFYASGA